MKPFPCEACSLAVPSYRLADGQQYVAESHIIGLRSEDASQSGEKPYNL